MHKVRVVRSFYDQSEPYIGRVGEVIGHWGADNNEEGRDGFMVQFEDGTVVGFSENEVEDASGTTWTDTARARRARRSRRPDERRRIHRAPVTRIARLSLGVLLAGGRRRVHALEAHVSRSRRPPRPPQHRPARPA